MVKPLAINSISSHVKLSLFTPEKIECVTLSLST